MRVILYVRVSTDEQAKSGLSIESQLKKLRGYADIMDHEVVYEIKDEGESAKSLVRPGMQEALELLDRGEADGLCVVKLDRLTRNVGDWQFLIDSYFGDHSGKALLSVTDSIDTTTAGGRLVLNVLITVAQWEREAAAERTRDALAAKRERGERLGAPRLGYRVVKGDDSPRGRLQSNLQEIAEEMEAREMIENLKRQGLSLRAIADQMTRSVFTTKRGNQQWSHTSVSNVLKVGKYDQKKLAS